MATTPVIAGGDALAVRPARVNLFAKPHAIDAPPNSAGREHRGVFDAAAACRANDETSDHLAARAGHAVRRLRGTLTIRRIVSLVAVAVAAGGLIVAISAGPPSGTPRKAPTAPSLGQPKETMSPRPSARRIARRRASQRHSSRTHHRPHRVPRSTRRTSGGSPRRASGTAPSMPPAPSSAPAVPRRHVPSVPVP